MVTLRRYSGSVTPADVPGRRAAGMAGRGQERTAPAACSGNRLSALAGGGTDTTRAKDSGLSQGAGDQAYRSGRPPGYIPFLSERGGKEYSQPLRFYAEKDQ